MVKDKDKIDEAVQLCIKQGCSNAEAARFIKEKYDLPDTINALRKRISIRPELEIAKSGLQIACEENGIPIESVGHYWYKGKHYSIHAKNTAPSWDEIKDKIIDEMRDYAPAYPVIIRHKIVDGHLLVIDPADIHIGKLCRAFETGEEYNSQIAVARVKEGVQGILNKTQGWQIEKILYIVGNDKLHIDTPHRTTTSGTPQDTDGMWYDNFLIAKQLDIDIIEILRCVAPVHVQFDPANHDYTNGFFLADTLKSWFSKCEDVTFNVSIAHRKYFTYGENLIGTTHGDGAKVQDLPLLMAQEAPKDWAVCKHRYFYTHHLHHKVSKDYGSVCVETLRSPSGTDSWHHRNGFQHSPKAIEGFIHHKEHGQIARITNLF